MNLNESQQMVARSYCNGEMSHVDSEEAADECGDKLFLFLLRETGDAKSMSEALSRIESAKNQLQELCDYFEKVKSFQDQLQALDKKSSTFEFMQANF